MHRLVNRLYYITETLFVRNPLYQLMGIAIVILTISIVAGVAVHIVNPVAYSHTGEAIWWAFLRLTDPGYLGDDRGFFPRLVSTILTIAGYVVFLGALVALMTNWLDRSLAFLASGRSPIFEQGHVLVIGWNQRIHALIEELVHTDKQMRRTKAKTTIVILCDPFDPSMYRELMQKLAPDVRESCRVLIRSGNPLEAESLERVDFAYARSIILIADDSIDRAARSLSDTKLAKILMSMKAQAPELTEPPTVVVEVAKPANKHLIESVGWGQRTEAVVADDIMGRIICQAVRFPGISRVYQRLLTDSYGDSLILRPAEELGITGKSLRELDALVAGGTAIGVLGSGQTQSELKLLELDRPLRADDQVALVVSRVEKATAESIGSNTVVWSRHQVGDVGRSLLVVGWSTDLMTFLKELAANPNESFSVKLLWEQARPQERQRLERLGDSFPNLIVSFGETSILDDNQQACLGEDFDTIVLLADQNQESLVADAENIMRCVQIDRFLQGKASRPHLVVELNDEDNRKLLRGIPIDVLMTSEILSHLLAQVSTHRSLMWIYEELFTKGGAELRLRSLQSVRVAGDTVGDYQSACLALNSVALGYYRQGEVCFNPTASTRLAETDQLIVVEMES